MQFRPAEYPQQINQKITVKIQHNNRHFQGLSVCRCAYAVVFIVSLEKGVNKLQIAAAGYKA